MNAGLAPVASRTACGTPIEHSAGFGGVKVNSLMSQRTPSLSTEQAMLPDGDWNASIVCTSPDAAPVAVTVAVTVDRRVAVTGGGDTGLVGGTGLAVTTSVTVDPGTMIGVGFTGALEAGEVGAALLVLGGSTCGDEDGTLTTIELPVGAPTGVLATRVGRTIVGAVVIWAGCPPTEEAQPVTTIEPSAATARIRPRVRVMTDRR